MLIEFTRFLFNPYARGGQDEARATKRFAPTSFNPRVHEGRDWCYLPFVDTC